jgi:hypothetical protein
MILKLKWGNHKLGNDIGIFNMGTATDCPSKQLGLCVTHNSGYKCYALKPEQQYPTVVPAARERQGVEWNTNTAYDISVSFIDQISRRRTTTRYIRYNESSDFITQDDVNKLSTVAKNVQDAIGVQTYGYSARKDLDFSNANFLCKGSGWESNNGICIVIGKKEELPAGYIECGGNCKNCNLCKINTKIKIAFRNH